MSSFAYTPATGYRHYPPYFNVTRDGDEAVITVRASEAIREGVYVCAHKRDAGPGRCVAGGPTCNNYCNMAPEKGPMADHPLPCTHADTGASVSMRMPWEAFVALARSVAEASQ